MGSTSSGRGRGLEPAHDLVAVLLQLEALDQAADEVTLFGLDLQVGPGKGTDELHQAQTVVPVQLIQHGAMISESP